MQPKANCPNRIRTRRGASGRELPLHPTAPDPIHNYCQYLAALLSAPVLRLHQVADGLEPVLVAPCSALRLHDVGEGDRYLGARMSPPDSARDSCVVSSPVADRSLDPALVGSGPVLRDRLELLHRPQVGVVELDRRAPGRPRLACSALLHRTHDVRRPASGRKGAPRHPGRASKGLRWPRLPRTNVGDDDMHRGRRPRGGPRSPYSASPRSGGSP